MTKKHFEAAAEEIRGIYQRAAALNNDIRLLNRAQGAEDLFVSIAIQFNPRFDPVRFRQACRPEGQ